MATIHRAEHVGSLLRPRSLLQARADHADGHITREQLTEHEDRAVLDALALQREAGIEVLTDGEMRRETWMAGLFETLGGVVPGASMDEAIRWHRDEGPDPAVEETHFDVIAVAEKVYQKVHLSSIEAAYLDKHAPGPYKITMMSSSMSLMMWAPGITDKVYSTPEEMTLAVADLQVQEIERLVDQGVRWIQIDSLSYLWVIDAVLGEVVAAVMPRDALLDMAIRVDNQLVRAAKRRNPEVTVALHFCRGNNRSAWTGTGSYDPVAERLFGEVDADRFLLEYETERAGGFEPLRFMPRGKTVVLGLISSKVPQLESQDQLRRRIDAASKYVPTNELALSPQCGFASTSGGNLLTVDEQRRKLELVADTAHKVWG